MDAPTEASSADILPAKRIRKQTDKDFKSTGPQLASKQHKTSTQKSKPAAAPAPVPVPLSNVFIPPSVALSTYDKASQLTLSKDQLICHGCEGGYRMVRATHGVFRGSYYFEVEILPHTVCKSTTSVSTNGGSSSSENPQEVMPSPHIRIGWSTRQGELQAPVGFDQYSYGYRDSCGSKSHKSQRVDHYGEPYQPGDVVGCHIALFEDSSLNNMSFYRNGVNQGVAYSGADIPAGIYFPAVSLYMKANVRVNFGPSFIKRPDIVGVNAVSELQPMNPEDRKLHEQMITAIKQLRGE